MKTFISSLILSFIISFSLLAQQTILFPGLTGKTLRDSLTANYKPQSVMLYDQARDSLFGQIYLSEGFVKCVYTGDSININSDLPIAPRTQASNQGFNTEHVYPQSKGAGSGNGQSDLHHLFPTRADVNSSRGNLPFADVPDSLVSRWWRLNYSQTQTPDTLLEEYSKRAPFGFEVRDALKGNTARAVFYFFTMYQNLVENADPDFFNIQINTLRNWHYFDKPDSLEYLRNSIIAGYQSGCSNPFIIDTTLVKRVYGVLPPRNFNISVIDETTIELNWQKNEQGDKILIVRNQSGVFHDPKDGVLYQAGYSSDLNGYIIISNNDSIIDNLPQLGTYFYRIYSLTDTNSFSVGILRFTTTGFAEALHYWNFNNNTPEQGQQWSDTLPANSGTGILVHTLNDVQSFQGTILGAFVNDFSGGSFAPRGHSNNDSCIVLHAPTIAHKNIIFSYATRGTATGYNTQSIYYSIDGINYLPLTSFYAVNYDWIVRTVDFSHIEEVNNNPNFRIKIVLSGATHALGNNRFDNFKIIGTDLFHSIEHCKTNHQIKLFPNPANDVINILFPNNDKNYNIEVFSGNGKIVYSSTVKSPYYNIDLSSFSKGIYYIRISGENLNQIEKLIKI